MEDNGDLSFWDKQCIWNCDFVCLGQSTEAMNGAAPGPFQNGDQDLWEHPDLSRHGATLIRTPMFF